MMTTEACNILFVLPTLAPTDSKLPRVLHICESIDRNRFRPLVSVDHVGRLHDVGLSALQRLDVPVLKLRMTPHKRKPFNSLPDMFRTVLWLRSHQIRIQHSFDYGRWWFEPLVSKAGGVKHWITTKTNTDCDGFSWQLRLSFATKVIAQSRTMAQILHAKVHNRKLSVIPNGVDTVTFSPRETDSMLHNALSIPRDGLILGCVAHLARVKDHPSLLRAFALANRSDIILLLIGRVVDNEYAQELKTLVHDLQLDERVRFLGLRGDIPRLHSIMDGIILTSHNESASNAILEGMASGLPVISSDCGGMSDIVEDGINGWLVPRDSAYATRLKNAIDDWASNPQKRLAYGRASRHIVQERFSLSQMVEKHIQLYESLLERDTR